MTGRHRFDASGTWVVERSRFDAALLRVACENGAHFLPHAGYIHAERVGDGFEVMTSRGRIRAKVLCACDGVFSRVARDFGVARPGYGFCLEGLVPYATDLAESAHHRAVFRLTAVGRGYAWAFPRADGYAVGVGGDFARKPDLRNALDAFCRKTPELKREILHVHGGMLPAYGGALPWYARDGVFLCGDAAQLVDRLTGEGLYYAIRSGALAGDALLANRSVPPAAPGTSGCNRPSLAPGDGAGKEDGRVDSLSLTESSIDAENAAQVYEAAVRGELVGELEYARRCAARVHARHPWTMAVLMGMPRFRIYAGKFVELLSGTTTYAELFAFLRPQRT